jgi:N utilization substance protein B
MTEPRKRPAGRRNRRGTGSAKAKRSAARLAAVQVLYQIELGGSSAKAVLEEFGRHRVAEIDGASLVAPDAELLTAIVRGASERRVQLDEAILGATDRQSPLSSMDALLRAALRAGTYELMAHHEVHPLVIITEYVEVTRAFYAGRESAMVNGALDRLARVLRPDDFESPVPDHDPDDD